MEELAVLVKDMPGFAPKLEEIEEKKSKKVMKTVKKESPKPSLTKH